MFTKKILFLLITFMLVFTIGAAVKTRAGTGDSATGWLWGGTEEVDDGDPNNGLSEYETGVGWISINSTNCDNNPTDGTIDDPDCIVAGASGSSVNYGVNIPLTGNVTGYAWSNNIGWIDFNPQDHCIVAGIPNSDQYLSSSCTDPDGGTGGVVRSGNDLTGWARIADIAKETVSGNSGGWEGWISMSGTAQNSSSYGVTINGNNFDPCSGGTSCAWSDELGWIDFSNADIVLVDILKICVDNCDNEGETPLTGTIGLTENDTRNLKACYNTSTVCDDVTGDVTGDSGIVWLADDTPDDAVSLSGTTTRVLNADAAGSENVSVTYSSSNASFTASVIGVCSYNICDEGSGAVPYVCETISSTKPCPDDSCSTGPPPDDCYPPDYNWREVAP